MCWLCGEIVLEPHINKLDLPHYMGNYFGKKCINTGRTPLRPQPVRPPFIPQLVIPPVMPQPIIPPPARQVPVADVKCGGECSIM
jgi:hypothetical protein